MGENRIRWNVGIMMDLDDFLKKEKGVAKEKRQILTSQHIILIFFLFFE